MSELKWKPKTGYSEEKPSSYELRTDTLRITVHRHIHHAPDAWLVSCHDVGIVQRELKNKEASKALEEALNLIKSKLKRMLDSIN